MLWHTSMATPNQFDYAFVKGDGNKGVNYRNYKWLPEWRNPPGLKRGKVFLGVSALLVLAAFPVWGLPLLTPKSEPQKDSMHMQTKQRLREERMRYAQSDDMPKR